MRTRLSFIRRLRKQQTDVAKLLWFRLSNRQLRGLKFRRQQQVGAYIVDFVNFEHKLIIELDGGDHRKAQRKIYDKQRTKWLEEEGYRIIRFWNGEVETNIEDILTNILTLLPDRKHPSPLNGEGGTRNNSL